MTTKCADHLMFVGGTCPGCGLEVDQYGNTEDQFDNCCFPDCGCDGARVCMAGSANEASMVLNIERQASPTPGKAGGRAK